MYNKILSKYINNELRGDYSGYGLEGIELLLGHLGNPHCGFRCVHIAGTNGKGTVSSLISSVLNRCGYKTGLYTSPHLLRINERIKIAGIEISDENIYKYAVKIDNIIESNKELKPTYFDIITAIAFLYFSDSSIDIAVVETGLGGRLDSTNVIIPEVSVITEISMDHASVLGNSIKLIAAEKAGIIKKSVPVVSLCTDEESAGVIKNSADEKGSPLYKINEDFLIDNIADYKNGYKFDFTFNKNSKCIENIIISLRPGHQVKNAAAALAALMLLHDNGFSKISSSPLLHVFQNETLPGRFQVLKNSPLVIFDAAHNYKALENLFHAIDMYYGKKILKVVLSIMADKINEDVKKIINQRRDSILYYSFNDERLYIPYDGEFNQVTSEIEVLNRYVSSADDNDLILFTGTFRMYKYALEAVSSI